MLGTSPQASSQHRLTKQEVCTTKKNETVSRSTLLQLCNLRLQSDDLLMKPLLLRLHMLVLLLR